MHDVLPTKLSYESKIPSDAEHNVLDFERLQVRLWNKSRLTPKEQRLFETLGRWNNIWVARRNGFVWCSRCEDKGVLENWHGTVRCYCPINGYAPQDVIELSPEGKLHEQRIQETPEVCLICGSTDCSFVTDGRNFYYVCDGEQCQREIDEQMRREQQ